MKTAYMHLAGLPTTETKLTALQLLMLTLPKPHQDTLLYLLRHLSKVQEHKVLEAPPVLYDAHTPQRKCHVWFILHLPDVPGAGRQQNGRKEPGRHVRAKFDPGTEGTKHQWVRTGSFSRLGTATASFDHITITIQHDSIHKPLFPAHVAGAKRNH
jgi:hypothetical protein